MKETQENKRICHHQGNYISEEDCEGAIRQPYQSYYIEVPPICGFCDTSYYYTQTSQGWVHPYYKEANCE